MLVTCFETAASVTNSAAAMPLIRLALRHRREDLPLARREPGDRALLAQPPEHARHDLRCRARFRRRRRGDGLDERFHVAYALLEEVAALRGLADRSSA